MFSGLKESMVLVLEYCQKSCCNEGLFEQENELDFGPC